jgi:hypothetical protein
MKTVWKKTGEYFWGKKPYDLHDNSLFTYFFGTRVIITNYNNNPIIYADTGSAEYFSYAGSKTTIEDLKSMAEKIFENDLTGEQLIDLGFKLI